MAHLAPAPFWPEHPLRHRAREILSYVAGLTYEPTDKRLAAMEAIHELESVIPPTALPPFLEVVPGTVDDVWALFLEAFASGVNTTVRDEISMALAAHQLRPWVRDPS